MTAAPAQGQLAAAVAAHRAGRLDEAERGYARVLATGGSSFDAWHLGGLCALQRGNAPVAVQRLRRAQGLQPKHALCAMRLGVAHARAGSPADAETQLRRAVELDPALAEGWLQLAHLLRAQGRPREALASAQAAGRLKPDSAEAQALLGALVADLEGFGPALGHFQRVNVLAPKDVRGWCNTGIALTTVGREDEALAAFDRALALAPEFPGAHLGRGFALQQAYRLREALQSFERVLALVPDHAEAHSARLLTLQYLGEVSPEALFAAHRDFGRACGPANAGDVDPGDIGAGKFPAPAGRLRVAFLSPDFRRHAVAQFIAPLLTHLDRSRFELWLWHDHAVEDDVSARLRGLADRWENFAGLPPDVLERRIRAAGPDIVVDLSGHTGRNRLPVLARRTAPLQVSYLGYPGTTGLTAMDARFVDPVSDPSPEDDRLHTERLVRFSPCAWAWEPPADAPEVVPPPAAAGGPVTFGSFNNYAKVSDASVQLWAAALAAVPGSRLLLKSHGLDRAERQAQVRERFAAAGVDGTRVQFLGRQPDTAGHLAQYAAVDVTLDTFPYHGTTTTCEALWMGRPVVTLGGDRHASRVGCSLLTAIGRPEWIASSPEHYAAIARQLASEPGALGQVAVGLRAQVRASALLDHRAQARRFGEALERCWAERWGTGAAERGAAGHGIGAARP